MRSKFSWRVFILFAVVSRKNIVGCTPITNSDLNDRIREFTTKNDSVNSTGVKTLQEEKSGYSNFLPARPVRFKDTSDSALSSSSSRGLLQRGHPGYILHEYEDIPGHGHEYHAPVPDHHGYDHHEFDHHGFDHHVAGHYPGHGHHDPSYHHKHYDHALAAKAFLWPIAGLALLGAAAALVTNPVLLQLGVVSGRRKRRDTEEELDTRISWLQGDKEREDSTAKKIHEHETKNIHDINLSFKDKFHNGELKYRSPVKNYVKDKLLKETRVHPLIQSPIEIAVDNPKRVYGNKLDDINKTFIPVPLVLKENS